MLQHKGLPVRLSGRSPSPTCLLPHRTSSVHVDEESFPKTKPFQQLCTAPQQQRPVGATRCLNAGRASEPQRRLSCPLASNEGRSRE